MLIFGVCYVLYWFAYVLKGNSGVILSSSMILECVQHVMEIREVKK